MSDIENLRETGLLRADAEAAPPAERWDVEVRSDEHAEMRKAVAQEYADALGERYEPPGETDAVARPDFAGAEIDKRKLTGAGLDPETAEQQIRDGVRTGPVVAGRSDEYGSRWTVDVPINGVAMRTFWILEPGATEARLVTLAKV